MMAVERDRLDRARMLIASRVGVDPDLLHYREYHWWIDRDGRSDRVNWTVYTVDPGLTDDERAS